MDDVTRLERRARSLLVSWCDALIGLQVTSGSARFDGGVACPACLHLHGRSIDAVWPLALLARETGERRYLDAAARLVEWGENLVCDDGSYYNDAQQSWNKTTIFFVSSLANALSYHGEGLPGSLRRRWEGVLGRSVGWVMSHFGTDDPANVNYHAAAAGALATAWSLTGDAALLDRAHELADFSLRFVTEEGFPYGEGRPRGLVTAKGCVSVDVGYALEETLPGLVEYALRAGDEELLSTRLLGAARACASLVLPDGGIDDSVGTRNFKWTWWGSRTSDGLARAYAALARYDRGLLGVVSRNLGALESCTHEGMLYGGPDYLAHGEQPCVHHQFTHAKSLAGLLEPDVLGPLRAVASEGEAPVAAPTDVPIDALCPGEGVRVRRLAPVGALRMESDRIVATVVASDYAHFPDGHALGGAMTLLWHSDYGPALACGPVGDLDREPLNTQLSRVRAEHASSAWRLWYERDGRVFSNVYDPGAELSCEGDAVVARFSFCDRDGHADPAARGTVRYELRGDEVLWVGDVSCPAPVRLELPVAARRVLSWSGAGVAVERGCVLELGSSAIIRQVRPAFSLAPGLCCALVEVGLGASEGFSLTWRFCPLP